MDYIQSIRETIYSLSMISMIITKQFGPDLYLVEIGIASPKARTDIYQRGKCSLFLSGCSPADEFPMIF